jgi:iron complex transport system substrate-binding protein
MGSQPAFTRIISLAPSITETLFAIGLGHQLVARTQQCDWPPQIAQIPVVGGFSTVTIQDIRALHPDLVLGTTLHSRIFEQAKGFDFVTAAIDRHPAYQAPLAIRRIGSIVDCDAESEVLAKNLEIQIDLLRQAAQALSKRTICYLCDTSCPAWYECCVVASMEFLNCRLAGRKYSENANFKETILKKIVDDKPGLIIVSECDKCANQCVNPILSGDNELSQYIAQNKIPIVTLTSKLLARPGPRAAQALRDLGILIYGPAMETTTL